jgi:MoaD family protein
MKVEIYGIHRLSVGEKTVEVELPQDATVYDALQAVVQRYPSLKTKMFTQRGDLHPYQPIYINGRNPRLLTDGLQTVVRTGDVLSIFSPISSGRINLEDAKRDNAPD